MKNQLVIARYNEDLDWLSEVPEKWEVFIYNKGDELKTDPSHHVESRPNFGREYETYSYHLCKIGEIDKVPDWVVFTQGNPFAHSPDFLDLLKQPQEFDRVQTLSKCWLTSRGIPPERVVLKSQRRVGLGYVREGLCSAHSVAPHDHHDQGASGIASLYRKRFGLSAEVNLLNHFSETFLELPLSFNDNQFVEFSYGAIFAVRNDCLKKYDAREYCRLHSLLTQEKDPIVGYVMERFWLLLFGGEKHIKTLS